MSQDGEQFYQRSRNLFPNVPWRDFWNFHLFERWDTGDEVNLVPPAELSLLDKLVTNVRGKQDTDVDVQGQVRSISLDSWVERKEGQR